MNIHIVDSVKGGSGKSTVAAKLCLFLSQQKRNKSCIVDLDLLGTSWFYIYQNSLNQNSSNRRLVYLNDLIKDYMYYKNTLIVQSININVPFSTVNTTKMLNKTKNKRQNISAIICDPSQRAKNLYKITKKNHIPEISYELFHDTIINLLEYLDKEKYTDIVFDMPPNTEPYSDLVLNSCFHVKTKYNTSLYMVSSINCAHMKSTFEWYNDFIKSPSSERIATKNNFEKLIDEIGAKEYETKKKEWYDNQKFKFFYVFNEIHPYGAKTLDLKSLIKSYGKNPANKGLAYYLIPFDKFFDDSMASLSGFPVGTNVDGAICLQEVDFYKFKLFHEL